MSWPNEISYRAFLVVLVAVMPAACGSEHHVATAADAGSDAGGDAAALTTMDIVCGYRHACALRSDGSARCWGGLFSNTAPTDRPGPFTQLSAGYYSCGIDSAGALSCWDGATSQLPAGPFVGISQMRIRSCGLRADGSATCFTLDQPGDLDDAPVALKSVSAGVNGPCGIEEVTGKPNCWTSISPKPAPTDVVTALAVGASYACATRSDGTLACWGTNLNGELNAPSGAFVDVKANAVSACARRADGSVSCWGVFGGLTTPYAPDGAFRKMCVGDTFACGILTSGGVSCWGENGLGQATPPADLR